MLQRTLLLTGLALSSTVVPPAFGAGAVPDQLFAQAAAGGEIPVIIELNVAVSAERDLAAASGEAAVETQRAKIAQAQQEVLNDLQLSATAAAGDQSPGVKLFQFVPMMALPANTHTLEILQSHPRVKSVVPDKLSAPYDDPTPLPPEGSSAEVEPSAPLLDSSVPRIGADIAQQYGVRGYGQTVAVLDTGVQKTHPFLANKVVSEACYSTNNSASTSTTVCPGGVTESTASGSGVNCSSSISGCDHGTHVAGIAAGKGGGSTGVSYSGVAPEANLIAVQVFSRFTSATYCGSNSPCILTWDSDQIRGLERVYALRNTYSIAAVNMSLGGGRYYTYCNSDLRKPIIDQLRSAGIATAIASGNDDWRDSVGAPGCIETAVTVGATDDSDNVASFSNIDDTVDFLAPGASVRSSVPTNSYAIKNGTSMATPHVAGAFALMSQLDPLATVSETESRLAALSVQVDDNRSSGIQDGMDRIALAWMGDNRCQPTGKITNRWGYDSSIEYSYIGLQPENSFGESFAYLVRIPNGTSLAAMVDAATGRAANLGDEPTVTVRGSAPCPTSGTLRYIYSGDYGFMTVNQ